MNQPALSVQLYAVNDQLTDDLDGTLARLSGMGLRNVSAFNFVTRAPELAEAFTRHGLTAKTGHATFLSDELRVRGTVRPVPAQRTSSRRPRPWASTSSSTPSSAPTAPRRRTGRGHRRPPQPGGGSRRRLRPTRGPPQPHAGVRSLVGGRSAFEVFAEQLRDDVTLEVDLYWGATAKQDLRALLGRLGDRVKALHLKDGFPGPDPVDAHYDPTSLDQRPAGQGEVPLLDCLAAAPSTEFGVIEFDHYRGDIFDGIEASVSYLNDHGLK